MTNDNHPLSSIISSSLIGLKQPTESPTDILKAGQQPKIETGRYDANVIGAIILVLSGRNHSSWSAISYQLLIYNWIYRETGKIFSQPIPERIPTNLNFTEPDYFDPSDPNNEKKPDEQARIEPRNIKAAWDYLKNGLLHLLNEKMIQVARVQNKDYIFPTNELLNAVVRNTDSTE